jgi:iron complex outermembrane receptor protein
MNFPLSVSPSLLRSLAFALAPAALAAAAPKPADEAVTLDAFITTAEKAAAFTLPLDAASRTGSRLNLSLRELPASVSIVTQEVIQLRGARTALEAIEAAVGMTGQIGVGSIPGYSTRGFGSNDVSVMRDGIRQNTNSQSARPLDAFLFDRIEILKGPASLLYGEGAVGGAVNYVTKLPEATARGEFTATAGAWDAYRAGLGFGGPLGRSGLSYRLDASVQSNGGYVEGSGSTFHAFSGALRWQPTPRASLTFTGTFLKDNIASYYGTPVLYDAVVNTTLANAAPEVRRVNTATDRLVNPRIDRGTRRINYNNPDNFADTENSFWRLVADVSLSDGWTLRNELYAATQLLDWRNTENYTWNPATRLVDRSSFLLIYRDDFQWGNRTDLTLAHSLAGRPNQLLFGALFDRNDQIRNSGNPGVPAAPTPASVTLFNPDRSPGPAVRYTKTVNVIVENTAFYVEDVFEAAPGLKLVGGLRWEQIDTERVSLLGQPPFNKRYSPFTGRAGAVWSATPTVNLYASYSRAAQPVSQLVSLTAAQNDFALQTGRQFEVGAKSTFWGGRADATLALFDIEKNDILTSTLDPVTGARINQQIGAQVSQGAEFAIGVSPGRAWRLEANLATTWKIAFADFNENLGTGVISRAGNRPAGQPKLVAGLFGSRALGPWLFTAGLRHVGDIAANNHNSIWRDAYTTLDASAGYTWGRTSLTLRGRNLTDTFYATNGSTLLRLAEPRSFELTVRTQF